MRSGFTIFTDNKTKRMSYGTKSIKFRFFDFN